jgi:hypothetical protein
LWTDLDLDFIFSNLVILDLWRTLINSFKLVPLRASSCCATLGVIFFLPESSLLDLECFPKWFSMLAWFILIGYSYPMNFGELSENGNNE